MVAVSISAGTIFAFGKALDLDIFGAQDREPERVLEPCIDDETSNVQGSLQLQ